VVIDDNSGGIMILRLLLFDDTSKQEHRARAAPKAK